MALKNAQQSELIREQNAELRRKSETDELTGVFNRRFFEEQYHKMWEWANRGDSFLSVLMIDADHFKAINDTYGHQAGDSCLKQIARLIGEQVKRPNDILARYGGEEFVLLLGTTDLDGAFALGEKIRTVIESTAMVHADISIRVTVSIGVCSLLPSDYPEMNREKALSLADDALYCAKDEGRNRVIGAIIPD